MKTQCKLRLGNSTQTAWIDSKAAVVGNRVEILEDGQFWLVDKTFDTMSDEVVKELSDRGRTQMNKKAAKAARASADV